MGTLTPRARARSRKSAATAASSAVNLREAAADDPGSHRTEHAGFHAEAERVPGSQESPHKPADAENLEHIVEMDSVGQFFEKRLLWNWYEAHCFAPSGARRPASLSESVTNSGASSPAAEGLLP